ncbi:MAG TPA: MBL fold metallo-hydrolase [Haliangiales bacterium]|nr:MBL fold metallo-hydrolase [Haliangiales bacterium]
MSFRQLFDTASWSYSYLLWDEATRDAVLIDAVLEQVDRDVRIIEELGLQLRYALDTHVHADHVTAASKLRERLGCRLVASREGGGPCNDILVGEGDEIRFGGRGLGVLATPGHTSGCVTYVLPDRVFTGDALMVRTCGRTDFQGGDAGTLYDSITTKLFVLPDETLVFPAHDYTGQTATSIGEEKRHNVRLAGRSREAFIELMANLNLALPKKIREAVPANLACGCP